LARAYDKSYTTAVNSEIDLLEPLRRYWGYDAFRPLQERIVRSLLAGHDACVVMPTGGGKSLCYQLPAAISGDKTAIVISPLIALMQDQVAQLKLMGIPAALLNSSLSVYEQGRIIENARAGKYRLLYLSPERLVREDTFEWLGSVPVLLFAIDEGHCISEWGHEFRPEYRQLSKLREKFPGLPIAAFTASATQHVRHDIIHQLRLRDADKYIASFHRPNLRYVVRSCTESQQKELLLRALRSYPEGNVIVYAPTIARVESTVDFLEEQGIAATPYHGQMKNDERRRNQEQWMSDETRVLVGTIAFGLGINKAAVRAVIHLSLPKSIEQYYQEAGRAGRDGLPADCVMLWQIRDSILHKYFLDQIEDPGEQERARQRYYTIRNFVESKTCRHTRICGHFGENKTWESCGACDACGYLPAWLVAPLPEEPRKARKSKSKSKPVRSALPPLAADMAALRAARPSPATALAARAALANSELRDLLREWRRNAATEQSVPAFVVMHDTTLDEIAAKQSATIAQLLDVSGIGARKAELYGEQILNVIKRFREGARAAVKSGQKEKPAEETIRLIAEGRTLAEIAGIRGRQLSTIVSMVSDLVANGRVAFQPSWVEQKKYGAIEAACRRLGMERLGPIKEDLPPEFSYEEIRLVIAHLKAGANGPRAAGAS
jgi:ATP-dependent DNA helicase RecQ